MPETTHHEAWADRAWGALLERTEQTAAEVGPRFPLYADPESGAWKSTSRGSWTGGFWAGLLWLRALASGAPQDRAAAAECTRRLAHWDRPGHRHPRADLLVRHRARSRAGARR
ncbi:hypothetical protein RB199_00350 [Streptomyces libani]